jgi:hypothetical protein
MVRLSPVRIKELQKILKDEYGLEYTDEQAQQAGLAIMRFTLAKKRRELELQKGSDGGTKTTKRPK